MNVSPKAGGIQK